MPSIVGFNDYIVRTDKQEKNWIMAAMSECGHTCWRARAHCLCGTNVGRYECACDPGYKFFGSRCVRKLNRRPLSTRFYYFYTRIFLLCLIEAYFIA